MATWKQPIPTDLHLVFGEDHGANLLYRELIYRASNEERIICVGSIRIKIKRGETLFSQSSFAEFLQWNGRKCSRVLEDLCNFYKKVSRRRQGKYTVVELLNYDELISFVQEPYSELTRRNATPKSVKNVKNVKKEAHVEKSTTHPMDTFYQLKETQHAEYFKFAGKVADSHQVPREKVLQEFEKFFNYWKQRNPSGKKELWQMQKVFDVKRRITTWMSNIKETQKQPKKQLQFYKSTGNI